MGTTVKMPRELRNRKKSVSETKNGDVEAKVVEEKTVKGKRKGASESDSPIPQKLQKITKKSSLKTKDASPAVVKETTKTEIPAGEPDLSAGSDSESDEEVDVQKLVAQIDPEDDTAETEEPTAVYKPGQAVGTIPDVSHAVEKAAKSKSDGNTGVIYIGRIPHGFYEHEMRQYFSQFGEITKLRLSRNKKTGQSKHFAFIEFAEAATADIVAKTMNNYLLFGHILKCRTIPKEQVHENSFKGGNKRFKKVPWNKIRGHQLDKPLSEEQWGKKVSKEQNKRAKKAAALKAMGYDFEAPGIKDVPPPAVTEEGVDIKAIEAPVAEVTETVAEKPDAVEVETTISAPKTKTKKTKARKVKA